MPINYKDYDKNWKKISLYIRHERAKNRCELCNVENGQPHWKTGSKVVLTVAHINHNKQDNRAFNLRALCQRCHLLIDLPYRIDKNKDAGWFSSEEFKNQCDFYNDFLTNRFGQGND